MSTFFEIFIGTVIGNIIGKAIASLEAWDKIKEELEKEYIEDRSFGVKVYQLGISKALDIIEEHLKEKEE